MHTMKGSLCQDRIRRGENLGTPFLSSSSWALKPQEINPTEEKERDWSGDEKGSRISRCFSSSSLLILFLVVHPLFRFHWYSLSSPLFIPPLLVTHLVLSFNPVSLALVISCPSPGGDTLTWKHVGGEKKGHHQTQRPWTFIIIFSGNRRRRWIQWCMSPLVVHPFFSRNLFSLCFTHCILHTNSLDLLLVKGMWRMRTKKRLLPRLLYYRLQTHKKSWRMRGNDWRGKAKERTGASCSISSLALLLLQLLRWIRRELVAEDDDVCVSYLESITARPLTCVSWR